MSVNPLQLPRLYAILDTAAFEARGRKGPRIALDMQFAGTHKPSGLLADRTLDDDLARGHVGTDKIEAFRTAFEV